MKRLFIFVFLSLEFTCNAMLCGSNFEGAQLQNATCHRSDFSRANLAGVNFTGSEFISANLSGANLIGTNFSSATLIGVNLAGCFIARGKTLKADGTMFLETSFKDALVDVFTLRTLPENMQAYVASQAKIVRATVISKN